MTSMIILGILALVGLYAMGVYNGLIKLKQLFRNAWSDVEVILKKRHDLIPNLVNTVKGYASHEQGTLEKVIQARNAAVNANSVGDQIEAEKTLSSFLPSIFALAEQYPDLKANENFMGLQNNLQDIENELSQSRRYYNAVIRDYNTKREVFPSNIFAGMFGFDEEPFFEVEEEAKAVPEVNFS